MTLPVEPPIEPMLAKAVPTIPEGMAYEPKWDGFRCLVFREGERVVLLSRGGKDLVGYFPELREGLLRQLPERCVLDGEIVVAVGGRLDFERLGDRIHPAQSRIEQLAIGTPASYVAWDVLADGERDVRELPFAERRALLETLLAAAGAPVHLSPHTTDIALARRWFEQFEGAGLDGVLAKPLEGTYAPGKRTMFKVKHAREADVVVAAWRLHKDSTPELPLLGGLQLGLYDDRGRLHFVGVASAFTKERRAELAEQLGLMTLEPGSEGWQAHPWGPPSEDPGPDTPKRPGSINRWNREVKQFNLLKVFPVATVGYEHMEGPRFRHSARFLRWRVDRDPESCTFEQLEEPVGYRLEDVLR